MQLAYTFVLFPTFADGFLSFIFRKNSDVGQEKNLPVCQSLEIMCYTSLMFSAFSKYIANCEMFIFDAASQYDFQFHFPQWHPYKAP